MAPERAVIKLLHQQLQTLCFQQRGQEHFFYQQERLTKPFFSLSLSHTNPKTLHTTALYVLFFPLASTDILTP